MTDTTKLFQGIAAVLFDLDGTLVDSNEEHAKAWVEVFAEHGHELNLFDVTRLIGMGGDKLIQKAIGTIAPEQVKELEKRHEEIFLEKYLQDVYPLDKANELIVLLKERGLTVLLATAANDKVRDALLARGDLKDQFLERTSSDEIEESKPAPDTLLACLEGHELEPHQCLLIGDTPYDGEAAAQAGMRFLAVETGGWNAGSLANAAGVYASISALYRSLLALGGQPNPPST